MQTLVALVGEERGIRLEGERSHGPRIAVPAQRSNPPPPPTPEQPTPPDTPEKWTAPFWTWFIENPRPGGTG